jgi:hypothetical protein
MCRRRLGDVTGRGETTARPQRGHAPAKLTELYGAIREKVAAHPDLTLAELQAWLTAGSAIHTPYGPQWKWRNREGAARAELCWEVRRLLPGHS